VGRERGSWSVLSPEVRREVLGLAGRGFSHRQIAGRMSVPVSLGSIGSVLRPLGGVIRKEMLETTGCRLSLEDRIEIRVGLGAGESCRSIAARLGRAASTVSREVAGGGGRGGYRPVAAQRAAMIAARRRKATKLGVNPRLCRRVIADLEALYSPGQIAGRLRVDFGDDERMCISPEAIYKSLYLQGRGELRRELARCLRSGRAVRKPRGRVETRGGIPGKVMISERPAGVDDRAVPGHWEGDLIIGKNGRSAIGTMVERTTRFTLLLHLPGDHSAETVRAAMTAKIAELPAHLARSVTWDQGAEMAGHARFSIETVLP
jgi:IS30 family transposase